MTTQQQQQGQPHQASRSNTLSMMDVPEQEPDFESFFQQQDQHQDMFGQDGGDGGGHQETSSGSSAGAIQTHAALTAMAQSQGGNAAAWIGGGQFQHQQMGANFPDIGENGEIGAGVRIMQQQQQEQQQHQGGMGMGMMGQQSSSGRDSVEGFAQVPPHQQPFNFPPQHDHSPHHHHHQHNHSFDGSSQTPEELLRVWSMQNAAAGGSGSGNQQQPSYNNGSPHLRSQPNMNVLPNNNGIMYDPQQLANNFQPSSSASPQQHNPFGSNLDPMTYRSPAQDRGSISPQPSPAFHPTHLSQTSITQSLSPNMPPSGEDFGLDVMQMSLQPRGSADFGGMGGRRLSAFGQDGALTPSYAGSISGVSGRSGRSLAGLEDAFDQWGVEAASDNGGGSYAPSMHGQEHQEFVNHSGLALEMMASFSGGNSGGVPGQEGGAGGFGGMGNMNGGMMQGFLPQGGNSDNYDHLAQERIAQYFASTSAQKPEVPVNPEVMFAEPTSYEDLALLTGNLPPESAGFEAQQAALTAHANLGSDTNTHQQQYDPSRINLQGALDSFGPSEFARRMNSMASDKTMSTSGTSTPAQPLFPTGISGDGGADGIVMPPFPVNAEGGLPSVGSRRRSASKKQSLPSDGGPGGYNGTFIKPSPPIGRLGLATKQPHLQSSNVKPASPPQLIIPDGSAQPPTEAATNPTGFQPYPHQQSQPQTGRHGTLLVPGNGLLGIPSGGNGMNGPYMSPIGPGGPSINIVPSTPTSALREGMKNQGIWENLASQARQQAAQGGSSNSGGGAGQGNPPWNQVPMHSLAGGHPGAYGAEAPRRNSHAGTYTNNAPPGLPLRARDDSAQLPWMPGTAPIGSTGAMLSARPNPPMRQRSRSETDLANCLPPGYDIRVVQHALMLQQQMGMGAQNGFVDHSNSNSNQYQPQQYDASALDTADSSPGPTQGNFGVFGNMSQISPDYAMARQPHQHVVPGPEAYGINYIVTADGRRVPFNPNWQPPQGMHASAGLTPGMSPGQASSGEEDVDQMLLSMAERRGSLQGTPPSAAGKKSKKSHRVVQSEDIGGQTGGRRRSAAFSPSPEPGRSLVNPVDGSLLPPQTGASPSANRTRDTSPYSRPGGRRASNASSTGSVAMSRGHAHSQSGSGVSAGGSPHVGKRKKGMPAREKVTTSATEAASKTRRTADGQYMCPVPGCGSTFTRQFNLKGHIRSHNEERPFVCTFEGCGKSFARQHDCKRHMQLHVGLKPFHCEGCTRQFARLDALSRHHKTDSGTICAHTHPLPTNPDGTPLTESKFKAEMARRRSSASGSGGEGVRPMGLTRMTSVSDDEEDELMEDVKPTIRAPRRQRSVMM